MTVSHQSGFVVYEPGARPTVRSQHKVGNAVPPEKDGTDAIDWFPKLLAKGLGREEIDMKVNLSVERRPLLPKDLIAMGLVGCFKTLSSGLGGGVVTVFLSHLEYRSLYRKARRIFALRLEALPRDLLTSKVVSLLG
jgi:hypothetical protein